MSIKNQANRTQPVLLEDDSISFKSCCTELFRWVRASAECVEEIPGDSKNKRPVGAK